MNWIAIAWSGFVGTVIASAFFWLTHSLRWTTFSPSIQLGSLIVSDPRKPITETIGFVLIVLLGSTVGPAALQMLLELTPLPAWVSGLLFGALIGLIMAAALPLYGTISASVRAGTLPKPGRLGIGWGRWTPWILVAGLALYGAVTGAVLGAF